MNENNPKKMQMVLWFVLAAVVIGIGGYVIGLRMGKEKKDNTEAVTEAAVTEEVKKEETTEEVTEEKTE